MSADVLRRAARVAREEWEGETGGPFKNAARVHIAVAAWLDDEALVADAVERTGVGWVGPAIAVARAYLGESDAE